MKIGIIGGTFDPIHLGHLIAAEQARSNMDLDEVWFMPSRIPPHKVNRPMATEEQRLAMVERAIAGHPSFRATDIELRREGISFTADTVSQLVDLFPEYSFYFIIGADMVHFLPKWVRINEMIQHIQFIGLSRPGFSLETLQHNLAIDSIMKCVHFVPMPLIEISSTLIRQSRKHGKSIRYLVPESVLEYIGEMSLYES